MAHVLNPDMAAKLQCVRMWSDPGLKCVQDKDIEWLFYGPILALILFIGVPGNILVVIVTAQSKITSTGMLLIGLAISDMFAILSFTTFYMPLRIQNYFSEHWFQDFANFVRAEERTFSTFYRFSKSVSVWMVLLITSERFIAVWKPLNAPLLLTKRKMGFCMAVIIVILVIIWAPKWPIYYVEEWHCSPCRGFVADTAKNEAWPWYKIHDSDVCFLLMIDYAFPLTALLVMTTLMTMALKRAGEQRKAIASGQKRGKHDETKMIIAVVIVFIVLETPNFLLYTESWASRQVRLVRIINLTNNAINFIIYAMFGKRFRDKLKKTVCCCLPKKSLNDRDKSTFVEKIEGDTTTATK